MVKQSGKAYNIPKSEEGKVVGALRKVGYRFVDHSDCMGADHIEIYSGKICVGYIDNHEHNLVTRNNSTRGRDLEEFLFRLQEGLAV